MRQPLPQVTTDMPTRNMGALVSQLRKERLLFLIKVARRNAAGEDAAMGRRYKKPINIDDLRVFGIDGYNDGFVNSDPDEDEVREDPAKAAKARIRVILANLDGFGPWESAREYYGNTEQARRVFRQYLRRYEEGMIDRIKHIREQQEEDDFNEGR